MGWLLCNKNLYSYSNKLVFTEGNIYPVIGEDQSKMLLKNNDGGDTYIFFGIDYSWHQHFTNIHTRPHIQKPTRNIKNYLK